MRGFSSLLIAIERGRYLSTAFRDLVETYWYPAYFSALLGGLGTLLSRVSIVLTDPQHVAHTLTHRAATNS